MPDDHPDPGDAGNQTEANRHGGQSSGTKWAELEYASFLRWIPSRPRPETGFDRLLTIIGAALLITGIAVALARHFWP